MTEAEIPKPAKTKYLRDARGRSVTLLDPYELNLLRRYEVIPAETLRLIARQLGFGQPKWQRRTYIAIVSAFLGIWAFLFIWEAIRRSGFDTLARVLGVAGFMLFVVSAVVFWRGGRRARARHICAIMLRHLRCPHCGYDIRGLPSAPEDGATVCPECGCAWQLDNAGFSADEGDGASAPVGSPRLPKNKGDGNGRAEDLPVVNELRKV